MKNLTISILFLTLAFVACKKKDGAEPQKNVAPTTTGSSANVFGSFQSSYSIRDYGLGSLVSDSNIFVTFYETPQSTTLPVNISGGTVTVNTQTLTYTTPYNSYLITGPASLNPLNISATGAGTVAAFNYSYTAVYPSCNPITIADTVTIANGLTFNITNIANVNVTNVSIYINGISKQVPINGTTCMVAFTASELAGLTTNQQQVINVFLYNFLPNAVVGNVEYTRSTSFSFYKHAYFK